MTEKLARVAKHIVRIDKLADGVSGIRMPIVVEGDKDEDEPWYLGINHGQLYIESDDRDTMKDVTVDDLEGSSYALPNEKERSELIW